MRHHGLLPLLLLALAGPAAAQAPVPKIPYRVMEQWTVRNPTGTCGYGRLIVINPSHRRAADLRALGRQLNNEAAGERVSLVVVYDNERAARMWRTWGTEPREGPFHDRHLLGHYLRNASTGESSFQLYPNGFGGPSETVRY
jgi:hypothetical protein